MESSLVSNITLLIAICSLVGIVFTVYFYFRNPQIATEKAAIQIEGKFSDLSRQFVELRETHLRKVEVDLANLSTVVNDLSKNVVRLTTIIEERVPKKRLK